MKHRSLFSAVLVVMIALLVVSTSYAQIEIILGGSYTVSVTAGTTCTVNGQTFPVPDGIFIVPGFQLGPISYSCGDGSSGSFVVVPPPVTPVVVPTDQGCTAQANCSTPTITVLGRLCTAFNDVNIRSGPGLDTADVGRLAARQPYNYYENQGGWLRIDGGWVSSTVVILGDCNNIPTPTPDPNEVNVEAFSSCMPVYDGLVEQGASTQLLAAYSQRANPCGYAGYLSASFAQQSEEELDPQIRDCTDPLVLPAFVDIWGDLTPATRENLDLLFQQRGEQGACALISNFVVDHSLEGIETDFPLESALEIIGNVCDIHQSSASIVAAAQAAAEAGINLEDLLVGDPCTVVETITLLGELDSEEQELYTRLRSECTGLTADGALELLTYAVGSGGDIQAMVADPKLCSDLNDEDGIYNIPVDDFTEEEAEQIEIIAGGLACETNPTIHTMLVMFLWNRSQSENLTEVQLASLLTAPDACAVVRAYLDTGMLPPPPVDGGVVVLPPPDSNFVESRLSQGGIDPFDTDEDGFAPFMEALGLSSAPDSVMDATAVFLVRRSGQNTTELGFLIRGEIVVQPLIPGSDIVQVALDQRGHEIIAVSTQDDGYAVFSIGFTPQLDTVNRAVSMGDPAPRLNSAILGLLGQQTLSVEPAPVAYGSENGAVIVTLGNGSTTQLYLLNPKAGFGPGMLIPLSAIEAFSPTYSPTPLGDWIAYVTGQPGNRQISMLDLERDVSDNIPHQGQNLTDCFEPVFVPEMPARLMFTCESFGQRSLHIYDELGTFHTLDFLVNETIQGDVIDFSQIRNVAPGPELEYIAFDDGQRMYFAHVAPPVGDEGNYVVDTIHTLISDPGYQVSAMRWATLSDTIVEIEDES